MKCREGPHVGDGLLRFLFSVPRVPAGILDLTLELREVRLQLLLGVDEAGVLPREEQGYHLACPRPGPGRLPSAHLGVQELDALTGIQELLLCDLPAPLRLLQGGPQLLDLSLQQVGSALHDRQLLLQVLLAPESIIQVELGILLG